MNICLEEGIFLCNVQCDTENDESCIIISALMQPPWQSQGIDKVVSLSASQHTALGSLPG